MQTNHFSRSNDDEVDPFGRQAAVIMMDQSASSAAKAATFVSGWE